MSEIKKIEKFNVNLNRPDVIPCEDICSLKVDYKPAYVQVQNSIYKNASFSGLYFSDLQSGSRVFFGYDEQQNYSASIECLLIFPSIHNYNNEEADAEFIILNRGNNGKTVIISIPVISAENDTSNLTKVLQGDLLSSIQQPGEIGITATELNLNTLIPLNTPYLFAEDSNLGKLHSQSADIIMFGLQNAITLDKTIIDQSKKIIDKVSLIINYSGINRDKEIGINKLGITNSDDNDLFDCQIKGEYEDEEDDDNNIELPKNKFNKLDKDSKVYKKWLIILSVFLIAVCFWILIFKLIPKAITMINNLFPNNN